ncbi:AraC family transcriptional regulator [Flavobacterium sp.]|uniref:helix-turn-helix domain-containing protein n=1 Tax=Flavobacterium sp. TaxID=239 RepID=UPI00262F7281|nr:AraC family transcriptional regulator [Flavobacterium sp.]
MYFDFNEKSSILFLFFFHGLVFGKLLLLKGFQNDEKSNFWLSGFTLLCSFYIAPFMCGYADWYGSLPYRDVLFYVPFQQVLLLPPVLYYYIKTLLDKSFKFSKKDFLHFVPAIAYLIYSIVVFVTDKVVLNDYYFYEDQQDKDLDAWYQVAGFISLVYYLILSLKVYGQYKKIIYNTISFADTMLFRWAKRLLIAFLLLLAIRALFFVLNPEWGEFGKKFWYYVCFSLLFYFISIYGFVNSVRSIISFHEITSDTNSIDDVPTNVVANDIQNSNGYETQNLPLWKTRIETLMLEEHLYENPELTLMEVCDRLGTHSKKISEVINQGYGLNFNDFINHYRTKAVIHRLEKGDHTNVTLLSIALDCGFNSKSTFNRAFKRYTNQTPKEYIETYLKK